MAKLSFPEFKEECCRSGYRKYIFDYSNQKNFIDTAIRRIHMDFNSIGFVAAPPNCIILSNACGEFCFFDVQYVLRDDEFSLYRDVFHIVCGDPSAGLTECFTVIADR